MTDILVRTFHKLRDHRLLLIPVLAETLLVTLLTGGAGPMGGSAMTAIALFFLHQAIMGGWLYQMKVALVQDTRKATLDDFLEGIGRYFWPLLTGSAALIFFGLVAVSLGNVLADALMGPLDMPFLEKIATDLRSQKAQDFAAIEALLHKHPQQLQHTGQWLMVFLGFLGVVGLLSSLVSLWPQYCVLANTNWVQGFRHSKNIILRHWRTFLLLSVVWLLPTVLLIAGLFSPSTPLQILAYGLDIVAKAYFTLLFTHFVVLGDPERLAPLPTEQPTR